MQSGNYSRYLPGWDGQSAFALRSFSIWNELLVQRFVVRVGGLLCEFIDWDVGKGMEGIVGSSGGISGNGGRMIKRSTRGIQDGVMEN